jgi:hypothetical protein
MKNMSFALTTQQILDGTKTVTRRLGWAQLKPSDHFRPVYKCMGLKKGEVVQVLRSPLVVVSNRVEPLECMLLDLEYGMAECVREGFGDHSAYRWPQNFVAFFCASHRGCTPETLISRIEFAYT